LRKKDFGSVSFGVFILTLALNARAGAFFVLPLLILWGAMWQEKIRFSFKHFGVLAIFVLLGFLVNFLVFKSFSVPEAIPFSNFGPTLYGMVTGYRGWQSFYGDHPGAPEQVALSLSMKIFLNSPGTFIASVLKAYQDFINPLRFFSFLSLPDEQMVPTAYLLTILTLVGLWKLVRYRNTLFARMILLVFAGIILSVPFVPPIDDGIRAMTATTSFLAILVGLPFVRHEQLGFDGVESIRARTKFNGLNFISSVVILLIVIGWVGLKINPKVASPELSCNPGETPIIIPISGGSYINVIPKKESAISLIPNIRPDDLQKNLAHYAPISLRAVFQKLQVGQTMMLGLNLADHPSSQLIWLIVPTDLVQNFNGINTFCAVPTHQKELDQELYIERTVKNIFIMP